jgi:hypothetical protein
VRIKIRPEWSFLRSVTGHEDGPNGLLHNFQLPPPWGHPAKTMATSVESQVQQRLQIQWVYAQELVQEARCRRRRPNASSDDDFHPDRDLVEEACDLFAALSAKEQAQRRMGAASHSTEPEWKRKIREKAERQEAEWRTQQNLQQQQAQVQAQLRAQGRPEPEVQATTIKSIRKVEERKLPAETAAAHSQKAPPIEHVRSYVCYCVIQ